MSLNTKRKIRVLMVKPGLDAHDRGMKIVAKALKDAGMEVIYIPIQQTVEQVVPTAIQEDVDVIGLSILSGAHLKICSKLMDLIKKYREDILVILGGIIPQKDIPLLKRIGIAEIFIPGTPAKAIIDFIETHVRRS